MLQLHTKAGIGIEGGVPVHRALVSSVYLSPSHKNKRWAADIRQCTRSISSKSRL